MIILANFASPLAFDLREQTMLGRWAAQGPREIWFMRPGGVLLTPVPLSEPFVNYACAMLGVPRESIRIITVRDDPGVAMADTARRSGLVDRPRAGVAHHPGTRLLPIAVDSAVLDLGAAIGAPVSPLGRAGPAVGSEALPSVFLSNTKAGFRGMAAGLGMRLPPGRRGQSPGQGGRGTLVNGVENRAAPTGRGELGCLDQVRSVRRVPRTVSSSMRTPRARRASASAGSQGESAGEPVSGEGAAAVAAAR